MTDVARLSGNEKIDVLIRHNKYLISKCDDLKKMIIALIEEDPKKGKILMQAVKNSKVSSLINKINKLEKEVCNG